jgi:hypothetical protein
MHTEVTCQAQAGYSDASSIPSMGIYRLGCYARSPPSTPSRMHLAYAILTRVFCEDLRMRSEIDHSIEAFILGV